jgi:glycosyltransferase involved in cell wall biosynthesis
MIRIAHLFDTRGPGGAETVLVTLVRGLDPSKFQSFPCIREKSWMREQLRAHDCVFHFLQDARSYDLSFLAGLVKFLRQQKINVVHSHEFFMNVYGTMAARLANIPSVVTVHGQVDYASQKLRRRLACRWMSVGSRMVMVSNQLGGRFHKEVGVDRKRMRTIYNGIDTDAFQENNNLPELRSELGLPEGVPIVGMVGNLYPVKGYPYFIRAMKLVKKDFPDVRVIICGRGKLQRELELLANECGLADSVSFLGFRADVPRLLQLMDVFVLSSLTEGLSLSILEAMAAGKPTVVTDVGGNHEIVVEGETGFLIPPENPVAIAEKVCCLLRDRALGLEMGRNGRQRTRDRFSRERMVQAYQELYETLAHNGRMEK